MERGGGKSFTGRLAWAPYLNQISRAVRSWWIKMPERWRALPQRALLVSFLAQLNILFVLIFDAGGICILLLCGCSGGPSLHARLSPYVAGWWFPYVLYCQDGKGAFLFEKSVYVIRPFQLVFFVSRPREGSFSASGEEKKTNKTCEIHIKFLSRFPHVFKWWWIIVSQRLVKSRSETKIWTLSVRPCLVWRLLEGGRVGFPLPENGKQKNKSRCFLWFLPLSTPNQEEEDYVLQIKKLGCFKIYWLITNPLLCRKYFIFLASMLQLLNIDHFPTFTNYLGRVILKSSQRP